MIDRQPPAEILVRDMRPHDHAAPVTVGYRLPRPSETRFRDELFHWGKEHRALATYVTRGPVFRCMAVADQWEASNRNTGAREIAIRRAYEQLLAAVRAHNAVVEPYPND